jgi:hypothetical protein
MKILQTAIIMITIVLMVIVSVTAFGTFSFAVRTNTTHSQSITTANATHTTKIVPSQITTKNPVAHNATTTLTSGTGACSGTDNYLWNHVYGKTDASGNKRFNDYGQCITVTGTVYSAYPGGTHGEPDGDMHFTLQLDPQYEHYSNQFDPQCTPHPAGSPPCKNIIVED